METRITIIALIIAGFVMMYGHHKACVAIVAFVAFGPVGYRYFVTGESSLVYEFMFRVALFGIACWAAHAYEKTHREVFASK